MQWITNPIPGSTLVGVLILLISPMRTMAQPANDDCAAAIPIADGITDFNTALATTDGPDNPPGACDDAGGFTTVNDIWFDYVAPGTGTVVITTCKKLGGSAEYDSDLVLYNICECPVSNSDLLACNDDDPDHACGTNPDFQSTIIAPVAEGNCYKIRVGGWALSGDWGPGQLSVTCMDCAACGDCPTDFDGDGRTRVPDLIHMLGCWGPIEPGDPLGCGCLDTAVAADGGPDGKIRVPDLISFLGEWGPCP